LVGLEEYFLANPGRVIHKWMHYFEIHTRHFNAFSRRCKIHPFLRSASTMVAAWKCGDITLGQEQRSLALIFRSDAWS
jgi:hypothetical protein